MGLATAAIIVGAASVAASAGSAIAAGSRARKNRKAAGRKADKIAEIEATRQDIIDPFDRMTNLDSMITSQGDKLTVATEAAEFEAEQADISLANTLDQMRAFGMGGGGATALMQGALSSKRGIAANIAQQEAQNTMARFQADQSAMYARLGEARRMQSMEAQGRAYVFETQENRDMAQLDRLSGQETNLRSASNMASQQAGQIWGSAIPNAVGAAYGVQNMAGSDRKLKKNIKLIGYSPSGLKIYMFEYINKSFGDGVFQGVMSDEIPQTAVIKHIDGYDRVDYSKLDVEFKNII